MLGQPGTPLFRNNMEKEFRTWLVLDYKIGRFRVTKKKPVKLKASDIPIDIRLNVKMPEQPIMKAKGSIELSTTQVKEMILENLES